MDKLTLSEALKLSAELDKIERLLLEVPICSTLRRVADLVDTQGLTQLIDLQDFKDVVIEALTARKERLENELKEL